MRLQAAESRMARTGVRFDIVFVVVMLVLFLAFALAFAYRPHGEQLRIFFVATVDFFADFFNVAEMAVDRNPYFLGMEDVEPWEHAYPPLNYVVFNVLARFADYGNLGAFEAGHTTLGLATAFSCVTLTVLVLYALLSYAYGKRGPLGVLLPLCIMTSSIFLFSLERGNIVLLAAACSTFFVVAYRSKKPIVFEMSLVALAVATALKGYPALFGMLLLFDRRFAGAARCAVYAVALVFLPFLYFEGGFANIPLWLDNIGWNSRVYAQNMPSFGFGQVAYWLAGGVGPDAGVKAALDCACRVVCVLALASCCFLESHWKRVLTLGLAVVCLQTNSAEYLGLYLFVGIVVCFADTRRERTDWVFLALFVCFLNPYQLVAGDQNITIYLMNASVSAMLLWLTVEATVRGVWQIRRRMVLRLNKE